MKQVENNKGYGGIILAMSLSVIWMAVTAAIGTLGLYEYARNDSHFLIILTVLLPTIFYVFLLTFVPSVRDWTKYRLNLAMLTLPHAWRTVGFTFLALWFYGTLPAGFAAPAGFGDFVIAIAAPFIAVALWLQWKNAIVAAVWFHLLGIIDLFFAILTGTTGYGAPLEDMAKIDPMTAFPMVIIPTVFIPLLLVAHVMVLTKIHMDKKT